MNICLVRCPSPFLIDDRAFPPLGLMSVGAGLRQQGHFVKLWDGDIKGVPLDYDAYGFGPTTPEYPTAVKTMQRLRYCKQKPRMVLGGAHATIHRESCLDDGWDCVVVGDGEFAAHEAFTGTSKAVIASPLPLDQYPLPDRSLVRLESYQFGINGMHATTLMASRGCPFHCGFCCKTDSKIRLRSPGSVIAEIGIIEKMGFKAIAFPEDLFIVNRRRTEEICRHLGERGFVWRCLVRADLIVKYGTGFVDMMAKSGCAGVGVGVESGSDRILKIIHKQEDTATMREAIRMLKAAGLHVKGFFIVGLPGENEESLEETDRFLCETQLDDIDITIFQPYPGSPIHANRAQYDIRWDETDMEHTYFKGRPGEYRASVSTSALSAERIVEARNDLESKHKQWKQSIGTPNQEESVKA